MIETPFRHGVSWGRSETWTGYRNAIDIQRRVCCPEGQRTVATIDCTIPAIDRVVPTIYGRRSNCSQSNIRPQFYAKISGKCDGDGMVCPHGDLGDAGVGGNGAFLWGFWWGRGQQSHRSGQIQPQRSPNLSHRNNLFQILILLPKLMFLGCQLPILISGREPIDLLLKHHRRTQR